MNRNTTTTHLKATAKTAADAVCMARAQTNKRT